MEYEAQDTGRSEDETLYRQRVSDSPDRDAILKAAFAAGISYGAYRMLKTQKGLKVLASLGEKFHNLKKELFDPARFQIEDALVGTAMPRTEAKTVDPDLIRDLNDVFESYETVGDSAIGWRHGKFGSGTALHKQILQHKYSNLTTDSGFSKATVADYLASDAPQYQKDILLRGRRLGIVADDMAVSRGRSFGVFKDSSGKIVNTQFMSARSIFDAVHNATRQFTILGTVRPADFIFGLIKPIAFDTDYLTVGSHVRINDKLRTGRGLNLAIGNTLFTQVGNRKEFTVLAEGIRALDIRTPGSRPYARAVAGMNGTLERQMENRLAANATTGLAGISQQVQSVVGFGHQYQTNRSIIADIVDATRRIEINRTAGTPNAKGSWLHHKFVPRGSTFNKLDFAKEEIMARRRGIDPEKWMEEAVPNPNRNFSDLTFTEKLKAMVGISPSGDFYHSLPTANTPGRRVGVPLNPRRPTEGYVPSGKVTAVPMGMHGLKADGLPASGVVTERGLAHTTGLIMGHMTERLNTLVGQTTGMGIRPTPGKYGWIGNLAKLYGVGAAVSMGVEYAKYGDYVAGEALDFMGLDDTTPSQYAVKAWTEANVALQKLREEFGVQQSAAYLEGLMPGSMSLPGMVAIRSLSLPAIGMLKGGYKGAVAGLVASIPFGGFDVEKSSKELEDIYAGKELVPVMKSRFWMMGLQPYGGNQIEYYRPHWAAMYQSDFRYTDVQYGSKEEYYKYKSSALTPTNLFGLTKFFNPDYYAEKHYESRPYPYAPSGARMHEGENITPQADAEAMNAAKLGYTPYPGSYSEGRDPGSFASQVRRTTDQVTELFGIYKYFGEQLPLYDEIFGKQSGDKEYAASADTIVSDSREFYDSSLGGALGMTELARRYMDVNKGKQGINLIQNNQPSWLPGVASEFEGDRDYMIDFHTGDPYAKIAMGEARLPGRGYDSLYATHSGVPGIYDAFDRFKILADVAPYSEAFKHYEILVKQQILSGQIDQASAKEIGIIQRRVDSIQDGPEFTPRVFSGVISGTAEQVAIAQMRNPIEKAIGGAWEMFTHDLVPSIGRTVPIFGTIADRKFFGQRSAYESYLEDQVYGVDFQNWNTPYESFIKPRAQQLIAHNPISAAVGGMNMGFMLFGNTSLGYAAGAAGAAGLSLGSAARMASTGQTSGGWIPESFKERNSLEAYFDSLKYERAIRNRDIAYENGQNDLVLHYNRESRRTATGMDMNLADQFFFTSAKHRLGQPLKQYADQFLHAPEESRRDIFKVVSPQARYVLAEAWRRQGDMSFTQRRPSPKAVSRMNISKFGMPADDWEGWNPSVPMEVIKLKTLDAYYNKAYDQHKFNLWESDTIEMNRGFRELRGAF